MKNIQHGTVSTARNFDVQGHRGARGLRPENTVSAFRLALDLGVPTLELDVCISADRQVVVSHDPFMSSVICSHADGSPVTRDEENKLLIFQMDYARIHRYDCGVRGHPDFPRQVPESAYKPLLSDVFDLVRNWPGQTGRDSTRFNIETKSSPAGDHVRHPGPDEFVELVYRVLTDFGMTSRVTIQSFDPRTLKSLRALDNGVDTSLLVSPEFDRGVARNVDLLGFVPEIYSPDHVLVTRKLIDGVHAADMSLVPWTVNEVERMRELYNSGADGFITDYPDRALLLPELTD